MVHQTALSLFLKRLANLTCRRVSEQVGLIKQALKHRGLSLLPKNRKTIRHDLAEAFQPADPRG